MYLLSAKNYYLNFIPIEGAIRLFIVDFINTDYLCKKCIYICPLLLNFRNRVNFYFVSIFIFRAIINGLFRPIRKPFHESHPARWPSKRGNYRYQGSEFHR